MNLNQMQFENKRLAKLTAEKNAFNDCRPDLSDVSFEIGKSSYMVKILSATIVFAVFFGGRILLRRFAGNPDYRLSLTDILFWIMIGGLTIYTTISAILLRLRFISKHI